MMSVNNQCVRWTLLFLCMISGYTQYITADTKTTPTERTSMVSDDGQDKPITVPRRINRIIISGNKFTSREAILSHIPYKVGEVFDPKKTRQLIHNLYYGLKRFRTIKVKGKNIGTDLIDLHIIVEEKQPLKDVIFKGNKKLSDKDIKSKINFDTPAIDAEELKSFAQQIKKLYIEKGFNAVNIETALSIDPDNKAIAIFTIDEGKKSTVRRIFFEGNKHIASKELRQVIFSREDWVLGFIDNTSTYIPERIEADKHMIEQFYQNSGFLQAKVTNARIEPQPNNPMALFLTFEIEEGEQYTISDVHAEGHDMIPEDLLCALIPLRPGDTYSREHVAQSIKTLEHIWGDHGYIFAHIDPALQPDPDTKTVSISFFSDLGNKVYLNRITIKGNKKTRDKIIRRRILLAEGEQLTQSFMDISKQSVESLGFFEPREGVNWKIKRVSADKADLDLIVKEAKTGHVNVQIGFGGSGIADIRSPVSSLSVKGQISDTNLFGYGINWNIEGSWSKEEQTLLFHLAQPWLFDRPITGALDFYHRRPTYEHFSNLMQNVVNQKLTGGMGTLGFITRSHIPWFNEISILTSLGIDSIRYQGHPTASPLRIGSAVTAYQAIIDKEFSPGDFVWFANGLEQDKRNHPIHTNHGHRWKITSKVAFPSFKGNIGFYKATFEGSWFTSIIGEYDLVLKLRGFFGFVTPIGNRAVPYAELFHVGGDLSVRGFLWGQIGPKFAGDPIGAKKALWLNAELIFPITPDMTMKGVVFYDGGTGWDNPYALCDPSTQALVTGNSFDYRHAVGFGLRLLKPMPMRVDWGFKLDPRKNKFDPSKSESPYEIHFGMTYDW